MGGCTGTGLRSRGLPPSAGLVFLPREVEATRPTCWEPQGGATMGGGKRLTLGLAQESDTSCLHL